MDAVDRQDKRETIGVAGGTGVDSPADIDKLFDQLRNELEQTDKLANAGLLIRDFCDRLWHWDAFLFSVRRGSGSRHFKSFVLIDTIDGKRVEYTHDHSVQTELTPTWIKLLNGESSLINRTAPDASPNPHAFGKDEKPSASLIFSPVINSERVLAVISVQSYTLNKFAASDLDLLNRVAEVAAAMVMRLLSVEYTDEFLNLGKRLNQVVDPNGVARVITNTAANLLGWDFCSIHLFDSVKASLSLQTAVRRHSDFSQLFPENAKSFVDSTGLLQESLYGAATSTNISSLPEEKRRQLLPFGSSLPLLASVIFAPVRNGDQVMGLICLQSERIDAYGAEEAETVAELSEYCSGALKRAWAQQVLKEHSDNYRLLVENINDGIVISQDEHFVFFNHRFASMLEYDYQELQQKTYRDIYTEQGLKILYTRAALRDAGESVANSYETFFVTRHGRTIAVEANATVIQDYKGQKATFAVIRDITERKEVEAKLQESEQHLRTLFDAMSDLILVLDDNGTYLDYGTGGKSQLALPWEQLAGKTVSEIFPGELAELFMQTIRKALQNNKTVSVDYEIGTQGGEASWFHASVSPLSHMSVLWVARDITERRRAAEELFSSNARYKALLDGSEDFIFVLDRELRYTHVNSTIQKRFGVNPEDRIGQSLLQFFSDVHPPPFLEIIKNVFSTGEAATYDDDNEILGALICTETVISPVFNRSGEVEAVLGISRDVTSRRRSALALQKSEERYAVAVRGANDGIWDWDLQANLMYLSPRWWAIIGEPDTSSDGNSPPDVWFERVHVEDLILLQEKIYDHLHGRTPHLEDEHRIRHSDGRYCWVLCRGLCVRDAEGEVIQMAGSMSDITARKDAEEKLQYGARHDALTGLPNRSYFLHCLEKAMARARRRGAAPGQFAVLFLDLDRFKVINDSLGHFAGDELLVETARRLEKCVRPGDTIARMGGDEFTVLLEEVGHSSDVTRVAARIIEELHAPIRMGSYPIQVTVSVGIAFDKPSYDNPDDLLRDSDTAMYRAKEKGRNRYQVFDQQMHNSVMGLLQSEGDLRRAVTRQEFVVYYQPVYSLATGRLVGFESLIRWKHPEKGLITPKDFIPLAEETGLIIPMGWWILDQAARASAVWNKDRAAGERLYVSVNISPKQFSQPNVPEHVSYLLAGSGAMAQDIILEITETLLMDESVIVSDVLPRLRTMGIRLALDDFGTGYSSLSFLRRSPLDLIKIDQSFVRSISEGNSREIVKAILSLANGLSLQVTAEGVETIEQYNALVEMKCDWAQGYLFHHPMALDDTHTILDQDLRLPVILQE